MAREHADSEQTAEVVAPRTEPRTALAMAGDSAHVLDLQRTAGNAAVCRMLARAPIADTVTPSAMSIHSDLHHVRHKGTAFVRDVTEDATGVDVSDIRQGAVGDCFFLSPLMAITRISPQYVRNMLSGPIGQTSAGADVYSVTLRTGTDGAAQTFHVDDRFVTSAAGAPVYAQYGDVSALGPELWVMLLEKAWAAFRGGFDATHSGLCSQAFRALTGKPATYAAVGTQTDDELLAALRKPWIENRPVAVITLPSFTDAQRTAGTALGFSPVAGHAYNLKWVNSTKRTLDIDNPHGSNHIRDLPIAQLRTFFEGYTALNEAIK